ncbi:MAG: YcxB family protein [Lawsonibacter sp.]|jgi:hypothetical protein
MEFTCRTIYSSKALTAMARALRKTTRAQVARRIRFFSWLVVAVCSLSIYISWGHTWRVVGNSAVVLLLLLLNWKEDALNGYFAKRKAMPGMESSYMVFSPDDFQVQISGAVTRWEYSRVLALAETEQYIVLAVGKNHAIALEKRGLEGGSIERFRHFLQEKTGKPVQDIGG